MIRNYLRTNWNANYEKLEVSKVSATRFDSSQFEYDGSKAQF